MGNKLDAPRVYRMMVRSRLVEDAIVDAWAEGLVPGEYHAAIGEEGINAGVIAHLGENDTMALDHRNTGPFIMRGTDPKALLLEVLGSDEGINRGMSGHMHIFDKSVKAGADGIVGSGGPLAVGQAYAHTRLHPGSVAVTFHGEATMNQGLLMESYNMAAAWNLPVIFVCKDNKWGITTYSKDVTGGDPVSRAKGLGLHVETAAGHKVQDVYAAAGRLVERARAGKGPGFLHLTCHRPNGHFEGDPLVGLLRNPKKQLSVWVPELQGGLVAEGGSVKDKAKAMAGVGVRAGRYTRDVAWTMRRDPVRRARSLIDSTVASTIEQQERDEIHAAVHEARERVGQRVGFGVKGGTR